MTQREKGFSRDDTRKKKSNNNNNKRGKIVEYIPLRFESRNN